MAIYRIVYKNGNGEKLKKMPYNFNFGNRNYLIIANFEAVSLQELKWEINLL